MKKSFFFALAAVLALGALNSCSKDNEENNESELETKYFTIEDATYSQNAIPAATTENTFTDVTLGQNVLNGGSSIVTVESAQPLAEFYVSVGDVEGHYTFDAREATRTRAGDDYVYTFTLLVSQALDGKFTVRISALTESGEVMPAFSHEFGLIEAGTGALQVNLSFNNAKDLDLYLVLPDGHVVFYGDPGWMTDYNQQTYEYTMLWGLDIDSNAGCSIDNINSENIFFPEEYVMNGKYTVYVNLYDNCNPGIATSWTATALYQGNAIRTGFGRNPASGTFPVNASDNDIWDDPANDGAVKAMEFTISGAALDPGDLEYMDYDEGEGGAASRSFAPKQN